MRQSGDYTTEEPLTGEHLARILQQAVDELDVDQARAEVAPFVRDARSLEVWSRDFLLHVVERIEPV
jgi:hypothetical protein